MNLPDLAPLLHFSPEWIREIQTNWLRLIELATFGDLSASNPSTLPRLRKRLLDLGERWRALFSDRTWIPKPREQLKNALGAALALRETLSTTQTAVGELRGGADYGEFTQLLDAMVFTANEQLRERENLWVGLLERVNQDTLGGQNE